jgi:hypothetical protein
VTPFIKATVIEFNTYHQRKLNDAPMFEDNLIEDFENGFLDE